jgi:putative PIN family toxin of toxin-antitoxin system
MNAERSVVDTIVLIRAALLNSSEPAALLRRVLVQAQLVFSPVTIQELETRLWRTKFDRYVTMDDRRLLLHDLAAVAEWVEPDETVCTATFSRDPADDKFVHAALVARAACLASGDANLLTLGQVEGTRIVTPARGLRQFGLIRQPLGP